MDCGHKKRVKSPSAGGVKRCRPCADKEKWKNHVPKPKIVKVKKPKVIKVKKVVKKKKIGKLKKGEISSAKLIKIRSANKLHREQQINYIEIPAQKLTDEEMIDKFLKDNKNAHSKANVISPYIGWLDDSNTFQSKESSLYG